MSPWSGSRWVRAWTPRPQAAMRILCFPWAGGSAGAFRLWARGLPADVELCAVEYPGRSTRDREPALGDVHQLAEGVREDGARLLDRPLVVLGYSLGALVAFEWLRALPPGQRERPSHLFACARRAPHLPGRHPASHQLPHDELVRVLRERFDAIPDALLEEPELLARLMVPLRADLAAVETYRYAPGPPLRCPVTAFGGRRDPDVSRAELEGWAAHTTATCSVEQVEAGHFFLDHPRLRQAVLAAAGTDPQAAAPRAL